MFIKITFAVLLGMSMLSYAGSGNGFKSAVDVNQQNQSSTDAKQQSQPKSFSSNKKQNQAEMQQDSDENKKPSMADYCRKHTC